MNKLMVKQLINKRLKGIQDKDIKIELKPTIFQEKCGNALAKEFEEDIPEGEASHYPSRELTCTNSVHHSSPLSQIT